MEDNKNYESESYLRNLFYYVCLSIVILFAGILVCIWNKAFCHESVWPEVGVSDDFYGILAGIFTWFASEISFAKYFI